MRALVNPTEKAWELRKQKVRRGNDDISLLCVNFAGTLQEVDIRKRTDMPIDKATGTYPYRFKIDNKILDTAERAKIGLTPFDFSSEAVIMKELAKKHNFDTTYVAFRLAGEKNLLKLPDYDRPLIFQSKGCNLHDWTETGGCTYCYVDAVSNSPTLENSVWLTVRNILDTAEELKYNPAIRDNRELHRIRHSGGETTTELDFTLELLYGIEKRGLETILVQFDTNLSTGKFIDEMMAKNEYQRDLLQQIASFGNKIFVYGAFKGTTDENIMFNTQAKLTVDDQIYSFGKLVDAGLDVYPCIYNPDWNALPNFLDKLDENFNNASTRLRIEGLKWEYGPAQCRLKEMAKQENVDFEKMLNKYKLLEEENYNKSEEIMRERLDAINLTYKEFDRTRHKISKFD